MVNPHFEIERHRQKIDGTRRYEADE